MGTELDTLRALRERELASAEAALVEVRADVERQIRVVESAAQRLAEADQALTDRRDASPERRGGGFSTGAWVEEQRYRQRLAGARDACARDLASAEAALAAARRAAEEARQAVVEAKREVEVLVKHAERHAERERLQRRRRQERAADELAASRFERK